MRKTGIINFPNYINFCATCIGKLRDLCNYDLKESNNKFKRGGKDESVDILGVKGELIFSHYLHLKGIKHEVNKLLDSKPVISWDIKIGNYFIDVKAIRPYAYDLLVNEDAHKKSKGVTHYAFVQVLDNSIAKYWVFPKKEVDKWKVKKAKYSNAYFLPIPKDQIKAA